MADNGDESWQQKREKVLKKYGLWERFKDYEFTKPGEDDA